MEKMLLLRHPQGQCHSTSRNMVTHHKQEGKVTRCLFPSSSHSKRRQIQTQGVLDFSRDLPIQRFRVMDLSINNKGK